MREGWEYKTFGEVGTFLRGKSIQKADFVEHGLPCIHYGQIHTKFGVSVNKHLSEIPEEVYNKSIIASPGDIVIAITSEDLEGSCKSTAWLGDYDVAVSSHAAVYKHNLNPKFIAYYLRSNSFYIEKEKYARGFKVMEIKPTDIARIPIPVPSEKIQSRVVSELDKINELIRLKKEQLKDYDNLAQSIFYEMFGDPVVNEKGWDNSTIESVCSSIVRGPFGSALKKEFFVESTNDTYKVYEQKHAIQKNHIIGSYYITKEKFQELRRFEVFPGDIIMSCSGTIGEFYQIPKEAEKGVMNQALLKFTLNENRTTTEFFMFLMNFIKNSFETKGTGLQNIGSVKVIKSMILGLPPLPLQQLFAQRIELIEQQKAEIKSTIADLETLLASRMQYWFD